ncbi:MAG: biotin/lipoyl-binding protein, partial [Rubrivivax sp.]|nr:biotin/lipoyl-binding protein [Rubrivivax sp.]
MNRKTIGIAAAVATVVLAALAARWVLAPKPIATPVAAASEAATQGIQLAAGDITVAAHAELRTTLAVTGSLKAVSSAIVKARVAGEVKSLLVREGDRVSAGQLIGQLDSTEYQLRLRQAEDQARAAQAQLDIAQRTLDNNKALVDQGFISRNALDTSVSSAAGANASLQAAR